MIWLLANGKKDSDLKGHDGLTLMIRSAVTRSMELWYNIQH